MRWLGRRDEALEWARDRAYARWAPFYPPRAHNALMAAEEGAVEELMPTIAGRRALDVGCGTGRYLEKLVNARASVVIGIDRSAAMLERVSVREARLIRGDVRALPLPSACVDVVVSGLMLMDVHDLDRAVAEMARVLVSQGVLVYSTLHPRGAAEGWTRTFQTAKGQERLATCWHTLEQHARACRLAGLVVDARREPVAGTASGSTSVPVALVIRATRVA